MSGAPPVRLQLSFYPSLLAIVLTMIAGASAAASSIEDSYRAYGHYLSGLQAVRDGNFPDAANFLDMALNTPEGDEAVVQHRAFEANLGAGRYEQALALAQKMEPEERRDVSFATLMLGLEALRLGQLAQAKKFLSTLNSDWLNSTVAPIPLAWVAARDSDQTTAIAALESMARPFTGLAAMLEGQLYEYFGDLDAAEQAYETVGAVEGGAIAKLPAPVVRGLARVALLKGDISRARILLTRYLKTHPDQPTILEALTLLNDNPVQLIGDSQPTTAVAGGLHQLALSFSNRSWLLSLNLARLAAWMNPEHAGTRMFVASLLEERDHWAEANTLYDTVPPDSPHRWGARLSIAINLYRLGQKEKAVRWLEALAAERLDRTDALQSLTQIYNKEQQYPEMENVLNRLIARLPKEQPDQWLHYYQRGIARERQGHWEEAEADFLKALDINPDQVSVLNYLGYTWVDMGRNLTRAQEMLELAAEKQPAGHIIDSLGWAYYKMGEYDKAVEALERAASLTPEEAVIQDHLGDAYWRVNRRREALYQWHRALGMESTETDPEAIRHKIEHGLPGE